MNDDNFYKSLVSKMEEVALVKPQNVGRLTPFYKRIAPQFKFYPWKSAVALSFLGALFLYFVFGSAVVKLASILQFGF